MHVLRSLISNGLRVDFGLAVTRQEHEIMFSFRFHRYEELGYLHPNAVASGSDRDEFDRLARVFYLIAIAESKIVGTARMVRGPGLKTAQEFRFKPPPEIDALPPDRVVDFGRMVTDGRMVALPKHAILLGLVIAALDVGGIYGIEASYAVVSTKLCETLLSLGIPVHPIVDASLCYPADGILAPWYYNHFAHDFQPIWFTHEETEASFCGLGMYQVYRQVLTETSRPGTRRI